MRYTSNTPGVVAEVIDGELVAIQLETGCYYHANATGGAIWSCLEQGMTVDEMQDFAQNRYSIEEGIAKKDVDLFITQLLDQQLIRVQDGLSSSIEQDKKTVPEKSAAYEIPILKKHDDMKELLLLDPIHDIGENAFPMKEV